MGYVQMTNSLWVRRSFRAIVFVGDGDYINFCEYQIAPSYFFLLLKNLGARGFSCAVSGFGQVLKSDPHARFFLRLRLSSLRPSAEHVRRPTKLLVEREK